ncbi:MAG: leucine-rich repeat domain-containing protein, partial [Treponema sp.]|nr:leucine-rich repeat domain-containing protein [Treponema sp.]
MGSNSREAKGGFLYDEEGGGVVIVGYKGKSKKIAIPATIDGKPVTGIGNDAFYKLDLTEVTIPDTVTSIGMNAFSNNKIASLSLGSGLVTIQDKAFQFSGITAVTIPDSVTSIGKEAFDNNKITDLSLGSGLVTIQDRAFRHNKLAGILTLPPNVTAVGAHAFYQNGYTEVIAPGSIAIGPLAFDKTTKLTTASGEKPATSSYKAPVAEAKAAAVVQKDGVWLFTTSGNTVVITGYEGTAPVVSIPAQIQGMP